MPAGLKPTSRRSADPGADGGPRGGDTLIGNPPWWEEELTADERRVLDPGPGELDPRPDVLVVGGGAVGLAAAVMCRRVGFGRVQVIERDRLASGPSGSAAGGLSPGINALARPAPFIALANESLTLFHELDAEWGGALSLRTIDWLIVSPDRIAPDSIDVPGVSVVDAQAARSVEPKLLPELGGAISVPAQSWVQPQRLAIALARRAGSVATGVTMTAMESTGGRVVRVSTSAGDVSPGAVVLATGNAPADTPVPTVVMKGHLLVTEPSPDPPRNGIASSIIALPLPGGRLLAGGTFDLGDEEPVVRDDVVRGIRAELSRILPATAGLATERAWCCFRPGTPDELPVIDRVPGLENAWMSVGHFRTGLLMAPAAGRAVASWIGGERPGGVEAFALSRFS
ncbi:MAG TPA: FAD-dependent oxidoreductase [Actinomycetota bacterium]|nr:FAD-dependent oxidoreductase [Actinomycetota bacterium]